MDRIGVLGAGSWGTALAIHAAGAGKRVALWARDAELAAALESQRENTKYLPGYRFPKGLRPTARLADLAGCDVVIAVIPSHGYRGVVRAYLATVPAGEHRTLISATKGIETQSLARMSEVTLEEAVGADREVRFATLSGPTFAGEVAAGRPSAAVIAADDGVLASVLREELSSPTLRLYSSTDVTGVELGGAAKNVIAIGAGIVSGLELGHNAMAALITRGLHEITRLGVSCGGQPRTFSGLAGLGDLVLTCTGGPSRNRRTGEALAAGRSLDELRAATPMVAEGVRTAAALVGLARRKAIEMPIAEQMAAVLYDGRGPREALDELMARDLKAEAAL